MQQALIDKGILRPSGEIVKDKINLISGVHTPPFVEMLWTLYGVLGLPFLEDVEQLARHPEAQGYFLFSFLLDYDDAIEDYKTEQDSA